MEEEVAPGSILCVKEEDVGKRAEVDEEGVEDPEEGEVSPVGVLVVEEVEDGSMNVRAVSTNGKITLKKTNLLNLNFCISELPCLICEFSSDFTALQPITLNFIHHLSPKGLAPLTENMILVGCVA